MDGRTMALQRPRFKSCYHVEAMGNDGIILLHEAGYAAVSGRLYSHLAPLIDGQHTPEDISRALDGQVSAPEVYYGISQLEKRGFLIDDGIEIPSNVEAYWEMLRLDPAAAAQQMAK